MRFSSSKYVLIVAGLAFCLPSCCVTASRQSDAHQLQLVDLSNSNDAARVISRQEGRIGTRGGAQKPILKTIDLNATRKFGMWLVPLLVFIGNYKVMDRLQAMVVLATRYPDSAKLPRIWAAFSPLQISLILKHVQFVMVASGLFHLSSLLAFPRGSHYKLESLVNLIATLVLGASGVIAFQILPVGFQNEMLVPSTVLLLMTLPIFSWCVWIFEFSGRELFRIPSTQTFLPKALLRLADILNIFKYPMVKNPCRSFYTLVVGKEPGGVVDNLLGCLGDSEVGMKYLKAPTKPGSGARSKASVRRECNNFRILRRSLLFQILYGMLTGIHLLALIVTFAPSALEKVLRLTGSTGGGCPYAILTNTWTILPASGVGASAFGLLVIVGLFVACQIASTVWGMLIWKAYPLE